MQRETLTKVLHAERNFDDKVLYAERNFDEGPSQYIDLLHFDLYFLRSITFIEKVYWRLSICLTTVLSEISI